MSANVFNWKKLFWFCAGLLLAAGFCMKWIEDGFIYQGSVFTIMDLELYFDKDKLQTVLGGLDDKTRTIVSYHLHFDFFFMAGVFPGIASICMLTREKVEKKLIRTILLALAALQTAAWGFDVYENLHLIKWLRNPSSADGVEFYHLLVRLKFIFALAGVISSLIAFLLFRKKQNPKT